MIPLSHIFPVIWKLHLSSCEIHTIHFFPVILCRWHCTFHTGSNQGGTKCHVPISCCPTILNASFDHLRWKTPIFVYGKSMCFFFPFKLQRILEQQGLNCLGPLTQRIFSLNRYCYSTTWSMVGWIHRTGTAYMEELCMWRADYKVIQELSLAGTVGAP